MHPEQTSQLQTLIGQARFEEAETLALALVAQCPDSGTARHLLGALLLKRGSIADALTHLNCAVALLPDDAQAHNNLGCALERNNQSHLAEHSYRRALQCQPDFALAYHNLGVVLRVLGRDAESEASLRSALALAPDYADAHYNLGLTLTRRNRSDEAQQCFDRALQLNPQHVHALIALGNAAASLGAFADAERFYLQAQAIQPDNLAAWSAIPEIRKMTADDLDWLRTSLKVLPGCRHPSEQARYFFSVAKFHDDIGEPDQAFLHYQRANEISKQIAAPYQPAQQSAMTDRICACFRKATLRQLGDFGNKSERPVFIVGMPRSGTSLVEQILASHPQVIGAGELNFWTNAQHAVLHGGLDSTSDDATPIIDGARIASLAQSYLQVLAQYADSALRITDKAPQNFANLGLILCSFPNARIVHVQRNPIDTCLSIYFQDFRTAFSYANDLNSLAHYYREYRRLMAHWRSIVPAGQLLELPYDALVADQEGWSRRMINFLGLEWDPRCLQFQHTRRRVDTASQWQVRQGVYNSSIERWRKYQQHLGPLLDLI